MSETESESDPNVTSYSCPNCGSKSWKIQNRICSAAAFFDPQITHVECTECGRVDEASTGLHDDE